MASMARSESAAEPSLTPTLSSKMLPAVNGASSSASASAAPGAGVPPLKPGTTTTRTSAPRIDIEPLYTALKAQIGDHWAAYKEAISLFVLGELGPLARRSCRCSYARLSHVSRTSGSTAHHPCILV